MAPHIGERCENCLRHQSTVHHGHTLPVCVGCLHTGEYLRRCASCKVVRYCSRQCQRAHWTQHKVDCTTNVIMQRTREMLGPIVTERQKTFQDWCTKNSQGFALVGLSALEIMKDKGRTETHVFVVYLDVIEHASSQTPNKPRFVRSVREARCTTLQQVRQMFSWRFIEGNATLERCLAPRPRMMRILVIDDGLPAPLDLYTLPTDVGDGTETRTVPFDRRWFAHLKLLVDDK